MKRIFIVDDHAVIRKIFREIIEDTSDLVVCGMAGSFAEGMEAIPRAAPDLVLMDVSLDRGGPDGLELIARLNRMLNGAQPQWIVVSLHDEAHTIQRAREVGAQRFLSKRDANTSLLKAIRDTLEEGPGGETE